VAEVVEGSRAVARVVALCRPQVVSAYPISPQTHIVEALAGAVGSGRLAGCEYVNAESELGAMSVAIGASAGGVRTYTATASQGLLAMVEAVYNAAGLNLPIVMTVANRALGAPLNIWNDQSDSLSQRDSGWLQLYAADVQEAADLHVQAYAVAERVSLPVMVCLDGFVLTHASEVVELPTQEQVDAFLPPFEPAWRLDVDRPTTIGTMAGPDSFTEARFLQFERQVAAADVVADVAARFAARFARASGGLVHRLAEPPGAGAPGPDETVVVAMGSVLGTLRVVADELRAAGTPVRLVGVCSYRPFPADALRAAVGDAGRIVVVDRAVSPGIGGVLAQDVRRVVDDGTARVRCVVAGLGGRDVTERSLRAAIVAGVAGELAPLTWLDLDRDLIGRAAAR
jgi:pyruvate ferredoxin oxidoreductase alpha subunit